MRYFNTKEWFKCFTAICLAQLSTLAQIKLQTPGVPKAPAAPEDNTWWYLTLLVLTLALGAVIYLWIKKNRAVANAEKKRQEERQAKQHDGDPLNTATHVDFDEELAWLREKKVVPQAVVKKEPNRIRPITKHAMKTNNGEVIVIGGSNGVASISNQTEVDDDPYEITEDEAVALSNLHEYPFYGFGQYRKVKIIQHLPDSLDHALTGAIEQLQDEQDVELRGVALNVIATFRYNNSIEALSEVALYDLTTRNRIRAIEILSSFDHESVFETIVLACADPAREVRVSAARALTRVSFDRADEWLRVMNNDDEPYARMVARAAIEGTLVDRMFDRLVSLDYKAAYEAFALIGLLLRVGEFDPILQALEYHPDIKVKAALLHVIKISENEKILPRLFYFANHTKISAALKPLFDETLAGLSEPEAKPQPAPVEAVAVS
jgi:hypothetical protein